jgi:hypothetical protein
MNTGFESLGRVRLQATLLLLAVFVIGALSGVALDRLRGWPPHPHPMRAGERPGPGFPPELRAELRLTAEQEARIQKILDDHRLRMEAIIGDFFPRMHALTDSVRAEVRLQLTPEQQEAFDRIQPPFERGGGPPPFVTDPLPGWHRPPKGPGGPPSGDPPRGH